ncbi:ShlB/FhaC/HecB family hemolysin secretion/activation protein [Paraburkholderia sp. ZP32-5]|uniref:ShlB/FhaC/HecB family hemolysin secretion/activation protein n=1 Tax=Paraburkholderia sp. ZP32-5 TaxID=2883245 RepID=UPI001F385CDE|nr:ShlB/FhaC/HecB family hemolysin secretion/activation protein [Paraburkholderia sp. ZP32-5]
MTCAPLSVLAAPGVPNAGQLLQQVQPAAPAAPNTNPDLTITAPAATSSTDTTPIPVKRIDLTGNTAFDTATLHGLIADGEGKTLTLAELDALAHRIADYYHAHGYPLVRAYLPPQQIDDGTVRIAILEARYGQVRVENRGRVSSRLVDATLAPLAAGAPVAQAPLDRSLLLLGDIPGANAHATLGPGAAPGTSDLSVALEPTPPFAGQVQVDNEGDRYTGRVRGSADLALTNLLHQGDVLSLDALTTGPGMTWGQLGWSMVLNGLGTQAGASWSALRYRLGDTFEALDAHGTAHVASAWLTQPLIRGQTLNLSGRLEFDHRQLDDDIEASSLHDDRHLNSVTASLSADRNDTWLGGGVTRATLGVTQGTLAFDNAPAQSADAATAGTQGSYTLFNAGINRLQRLTDATRLYVAFSYQHANRNVDTSEQWLLGGPGTVRGYPVSTLGGASGFLATAELRHDFVLPVVGKVQGEAFVDSGEVTINQDPWQPGVNHAHLTGAGVGLDWSGPRGIVAKLQVAVPVGATPELAGPRPSIQVWAQIAMGF